MSDPFNSFDFKVENYLNWVNTVAKKADANRRRNKPRQRPKVRRTAWGCALPSSAIGLLLLALLTQIVV
jgi:hypothetical protein